MGLTHTSSLLMALQRELRLVEEVKRHSVASSYASSIASWDGESDLGGSDNEFAAPASAAQDGKHVIPEDKERDRRGKATFHLKPWHEQNWFERLLTTGVADDVVYRRKAQRREGMPEHSPWRENVWILPRALFAPALQQLSYWVWPEWQWPVGLAYTVYLFSFFAFMTDAVARLNFFAALYGTFGEERHGRDRPIDSHVDSLFWLNVYFLAGRTVVDFGFHWDKTAVPIESFGWTFPLRMFAYLVLLDYLFYCYHRFAHDHEGAWAHHSSHHGTRHPSALLSIDNISNFSSLVEFLVIPVVLAAAIPMTFHELYVAICYTAYTEAAGHSGIRAVFVAPVTGPVLEPFGLEITVEDHEIHHNDGRGGKNYGKQTMIFDILFGTRVPRRETPDRWFGLKNAGISQQ